MQRVHVMTIPYSTHRRRLFVHVSCVITTIFIMFSRELYVLYMYMYAHVHVHVHVHVSCGTCGHVRRMCRSSLDYRVARRIRFRLSLGSASRCEPCVLRSWFSHHSAISVLSFVGEKLFQHLCCTCISISEHTFTPEPRCVYKYVTAGTRVFSKMPLTPCLCLFRVCGVCDNARTQTSRVFSCLAVLTARAARSCPLFVLFFFSLHAFVHGAAAASCAAPMRAFADAGATNASAIGCHHATDANHAAFTA